MSAETREAARLLVDWWGKCLTCRHHRVDNTLRDATTDTVVNEWGRCRNDRSPNAGSLQGPNGYCQQWDPKELRVALRILELEDAGTISGDEILAAIAAES